MSAGYRPEQREAETSHRERFRSAMERDQAAELAEMRAEVERLKLHAVALAETARLVEQGRCAQIVENYNPGGSYHIRSSLATEIRRPGNAGEGEK
jgi:hypothetical protein